MSIEEVNQELYIMCLGIREGLPLLLVKTCLHLYRKVSILYPTLLHFSFIFLDSINLSTIQGFCMD